MRVFKKSVQKECSERVFRRRVTRKSVQKEGDQKECSVRMF